MDLDLDKPVYITEFCNNDKNNCIGYVGNKEIKKSDYKIVDVDIHGLYQENQNCITIAIET